MIQLQVGDILVEQASLQHSAENQGRTPVVIELSSLLRSGAPTSTVWVVGLRPLTDS